MALLPLAGWAVDVTTAEFTIGSTTLEYVGKKTSPAITSATVGGNPITSSDYSLKFYKRTGETIGDEVANLINVGDYFVRLYDGEHVSNMKLAFSIVKVDMTISLKNVKKTYGAADPIATDFEYTVLDGFVGDDDKNSVVINVSVPAENARVAGEHVGFYNYSGITATSQNYNIRISAQPQLEIKPATLTVTHAALSELVLRRIEQADFDDPLKNTAEAEIETNNGKFVDVSFTFPGQTMYANKWYTMVLPFATTVREISNAFGYAVVDVFNTNGNNPDDVAFSLHIGTVNANEPFLIKVDQDITADDFEDPSGPMIEAVKIEKPASAIELSDAYGNKIVGTYSGINGGFDADYDWGLGLGKTATDWQPFNKQFVRPLGAYIHYKDRQSHNARTISIEEPDGSTTVINSVTGDQINFSKDAIYNMNGVKMQSIPTEKGVYIQNGKKIVIK